MLVEGRRVLRNDVVGAVLEAQQVARRRLGQGGLRRPAEARLRPANRRLPVGDPGEVPDRVHRHLRIIGAGLHAEIAVTPFGLQGVAREWRQIRQGRRTQRPKPEPVDTILLEEPRAEADGHRQPARRQVERLPRVVGRRLRVAADRARGAHLEALRHARRRDRPVAQQPLETESGRVLDDVERGELDVILGRCRDAGLVRPEERIDGRARSAGPAGPRHDQLAGQPTHRQPGRAGRGSPQQLAPAQPGWPGRCGSGGRGVLRLGHGRIVIGDRVTHLGFDVMKRWRTETLRWRSPRAWRQRLPRAPKRTGSIAPGTAGSGARAATPSTR